MQSSYKPHHRPGCAAILGTPGDALLEWLSGRLRVLADEIAPRYAASGAAALSTGGTGALVAGGPAPAPRPSRAPDPLTLRADCSLRVLVEVVRLLTPMALAAGNRPAQARAAASVVLLWLRRVSSLPGFVPTPPPTTVGTAFEYVGISQVFLLACAARLGYPRSFLASSLSLQQPTPQGTPVTPPIIRALADTLEAPVPAELRASPDTADLVAAIHVKACH